MRKNFWDPVPNGPENERRPHSKRHSRVSLLAAGCERDAAPYTDQNERKGPSGGNPEGPKFTGNSLGLEDRRTDKKKKRSDT